MRVSVMVLGLALLVPVCLAADEVPLKDQKSKESYSLGYEFGNNLKRQGVEIDVDVLLSAVSEGLEGKPSALAPEDMRDTLLKLRKKLMVRQEQLLREYSARNLDAGKAFLDANKGKDGVKTLPSGLQYKIIKAGAGSMPKVTDSVTVNYRGTLIDGKEFDSSYVRNEPSTLSLAGAIRGWQEALQLMNTGSKWQIFVPAELAYGNRQSDRIPPNSVLIFDLELLSISDGSHRNVPEPKTPAMNGQDRVKARAKAK